MQLIGMLDSPYVRRVAISLRLLGLPFEHRNLSVFGAFEQVREINPVVKVPTLVCDDGFVLMESELILAHLEVLAGRSLWPADALERRRALRIVGLALGACEKTVQIVYERRMRPAEMRYEPWLARIRTQLAGACAGLEAELAAHPLPLDDAGRITHAAVAAGVAWRFTQLHVSDTVAPPAFPVLAAFSAQAERLPVFAAIPPDEAVDASYAG